LHSIYLSEKYILEIKDKFKPAYLLLLAVYSVSILMHVASQIAYYSKVTALFSFISLLLFLDYRKWYFSYLPVIIPLVVFIPQFPRLANHANVETLISIFLIILLIRKFIFKDSSLDPNNVNQIFRITLIGLYFTAGFHKLNSGFFAIEGSCSTTIGIHNKIFGHHTNFTTSYYLSRLMQCTTIIIEMIVPFGMLIKRTRTLTVVVLGCFHIYLSFCGFVNFSSFAIFLIAGSVLNFESENIDKRLVKGVKYLIIFSVFAAVSTKLLYWSKLLPHQYIFANLACWFSIGLAVFFYSLIYYNRISVKRYNFVWYHPVILFAIFLWGSQCYLGLSTASSLSMFSNLVTEKGHNNHYLIDTRKTKIWDYEEDHVTFIDIPHKFKLHNRREILGYSIPLVELKKSIVLWQRFKEPIPCTISYKGDTIVLTDIKTSKFADPDTEWWHRFLYYRKINLKQNECLW
jgi:hypothetical protein